LFSISLFLRCFLCFNSCSNVGTLIKIEVIMHMKL